MGDGIGCFFDCVKVFFDFIFYEIENFVYFVCVDVWCDIDQYKCGLVFGVQFIFCQYVGEFIE